MSKRLQRYKPIFAWINHEEGDGFLLYKIIWMGIMEYIHFYSVFRKCLYGVIK